MESLRIMMEEMVGVERDNQLISGDQAQQRVEALRDMFGNWRYKTVGQLREVMTTAHFTQYFSDSLSRMFYQDYEYQYGSWREYTRPDTTPDFRKVDRGRQTYGGGMHRRREKADLKAGHVDQSWIDYGVDEFADYFNVSWQTILNDDLGKIRETPQQMVRSAVQFEDEFVSDLYDNATTQATLSALGSPWAITGRLTHENLAVAVTAMRQRTDAQGKKIRIRSLHLVIPPELEVQAATILESAQASGVATNDENVLPRFIRAVHMDPYIATSGADVPWYLFADPSEIPVVSVARLQGWPRPIVYKRMSDIEMLQGSVPAAFLMGSFDSGDIEYAVQTVIGGWDDDSYVGVTDYRGILYSSGTTA